MPGNYIENNPEELLKSQCPNCGATPGKKGWHLKDKAQEWGAPDTPGGISLFGERWHCERCDNWHIIKPFNPLDHAPVRGSEVEAWLVANRDGYGNGEAGADTDITSWHALDSLVNAYRDMADTGYTLAEARAESAL